MRALRSTTLALAAATVFLAGAPAVADDGGFTIEDPRIDESSGLAASRRHPGVYWTHNDQDEPRVFAVDSRTGKTVATVTFSGVGRPRDMEAVSVGPDGDLYVGDIGDNLNGSWDHVWIYRFPEPAELRDQTVKAVQYVVKYADGPRDAESLMIHPKTGRAYIASKNKQGGGLYEGPAKLSARGTNTFRRVAEVPWVTDGAFSPDGAHLALRGYLGAWEYPWKDGRPGGEEALAIGFEGQSESVTYTPDGSALMFGAEGVRSRVTRLAVDRPGAERPSNDGGSPSGEAGKGDGGGGQSKGNFTLGVVVLAVATALTLGIKRMLRRD
ncbi:WD40 repeat domain-containing protein [Streptomyces sp. NPDC001941]|uniref:WD40 repeat domain-containing protein n=1 Tax=Streptomyces sp. NPDC001941 TaxID=3154659 RepID=UPI003318BF98